MILLYSIAVRRGVGTRAVRGILFMERAAIHLSLSGARCRIGAQPQSNGMERAQLEFTARPPSNSMQYRSIPAQRCIDALRYVTLG